MGNKFKTKTTREEKQYVYSKDHYAADITRKGKGSIFIGQHATRLRYLAHQNYRREEIIGSK